MVKIKHGLAGLAALGLMAAPAMAETRSGQALPPASAQADSSAVSLASQPVEGADSLGAGFSPALLLALLAIVAAIVAAAGGGGGGGNDSPG
jgi:hypothetical protein